VVLRHLDEMLQAAATLLESEGVAAADRRHAVQLDLRYAGQYHEVVVDVPESMLRAGDLHAIRELFDAAHNRLYGYDLAQEQTPVALVNIRLAATGLVKKPPLPTEPKVHGDASCARKGARGIYLPSRSAFAEVPVFDGERLRHGHSLRGPAVIETVNTTIILPDGFDLAVDAVGTSVLTSSQRPSQ